jgi:hypothetical protein
MMPELQTSEPLRITEVTEGGGWYQIATDGQPKKFKTNREELGAEAGRYKVEGTRLIVSYQERNDKPNPHGGFYHDFYYYGAKPAPPQAEADGADDGITRVKQIRPETAPEEAWRISLSVGTERAVALAPHLPQGQQDFPFIWALAYEFAARIYLTPPPNPDSLEPLPVGLGGGAAYTDPTEPPGDDEDIPF